MNPQAAGSLSLQSPINVQPAGTTPAPGNVMGLNTGSQSAPPYQPPVGGGGGQGGTVNNTPGTAGFGMNLPEYLAGIQQEYNTAVQQGSAQIAQNQAYQPVQIGDINSVAQGNINAANTQTGGQNNVYQSQIAGTQGQQTLSLAELADQIRGANQGFQSQLGAQGAGFSSAAPMGQFALAHEQNINRANIQQQAGSNIATVQNEIQANNSNLSQYVSNINTWKQQQIDAVVKNYNTIQSQLEQAIGQAQGEEKARLAMFGATLQDAAGSALTQIDQTVQSALNANGTNFAQGQPNFQANAQGQAPSAIQTPQVSPFAMNTTSDQGTGNLAGGSLVNILKQQAAGAAA